MDTDLEDHPKFHALIVRRGWTPERGLAFFYRLLRTVRCHAPDGDITAWDDAYLGRMTNVLKPAGLLADLIAVGLVDVDQVDDEPVNDRRYLHGWMERNGQWIKSPTAEARAAGGRKGGTARAATGQRDKAGRYMRLVKGGGQ
jgi:hypothetical protein